MNTLIIIRKISYRFFYLFDQLFGKKAKIFILCYHSISKDWIYGISVKEFKNQINFLEQYYNFINPKQLTDFLSGKINIIYPSVLITFDDGYEDIFQVKDFLKSKEINPLLFLLADPENVNRKELANDKKLLSKKQIEELIDLGWEIGNHGQTHADFWTLSDRSIKSEVNNSQKILFNKYGIRSKYFAYPKGRYNDQILHQIKNAKYELAFSMDDGFLTNKTNKFTIPRIGINQTHSFEEFKSLFSPSVVQFRRFCKSIRLERAFG